MAKYITFGSEFTHEGRTYVATRFVSLFQDQGDYGRHARNASLVVEGDTRDGRFSIHAGADHLRVRLRTPGRESAP